MSPQERPGPMISIPEPAEACRLCGSPTAPRFEVPLSRGLTGRYRECTACGFLRSSHVDAVEARDAVYGSADPGDDRGAAFRQLCIALRLTQLVRARLVGFGPAVRLLDFGTATGFLPASLGLRFGWTAVGFEPYGRPSFDPARVRRDWADVAASGPFDLVVASEVLEHFTDPVPEIERIARVMRPDRSFLYATTTLYEPGRCGPDWSYLAPHTAQHCAFYSRQALANVAARIDAALVQLSAPHANEWLFVRGDRRLVAQARAAAWVIRALMRRQRIPGFL